MTWTDQYSTNIGIFVPTGIRILTRVHVLYLGILLTIVQSSYTVMCAIDPLVETINRKEDYESDVYEY